MKPPLRVAPPRRRAVRGRPGFALASLALLAALSACGKRGAPADNGADGEQPRQVANVPIATSATQGLPGTPMAKREAIIALLNKRNGLTRDLKMKPGEALRIGSAIVRLRACEQTAPWEEPSETGAFVQLDVLETRDGKWRRAFSGWVFKNRPDRNMVQHPIYDVWVKSCTMSWPETGDETVLVASPKKSGATNSSSAPNAAAADSGSSSGTLPTASSNSAE